MVLQPTRVKYLRLTDNFAQLDMRPDASWVELDTFTAEENSSSSSSSSNGGAPDEEEWLSVRLNP